MWARTYWKDRFDADANAVYKKSKESGAHRNPDMAQGQPGQPGQASQGQPGQASQASQAQEPCY